MNPQGIYRDSKLLGLFNNLATAMESILVTYTNMDVDVETVPPFRVGKTIVKATARDPEYPMVHTYTIVDMEVHTTPQHL